MASAWKIIPCALSELRLDHTLKCGQSFRWKEVTPGVWTGVIGHQVWRLKQDASHVYYQVFPGQGAPDPCKSDQSLLTQIKSEPKQSIHQAVKSDEHKIKMECPVGSSEMGDGDTNVNVIRNKKLELKEEPLFSSEKDVNESVLRDYFQLNVNLGKLYKSWSAADQNFKKISSSFQGIRMLRQDPVENLFSFICSSNNHISRISSMVEKLCDHYGDKIMEVDGKLYHTFPQVSVLAAPGVEARLRELGFGYRAKYINVTAKYICDNHTKDWLYSLRNMPYEDTKRELMKLCGVGAKVADCVCLMSMDKPGSIPVDTHVWQIAARHYIPKLQHSKSLTDKLYREIGDSFRTLWGEYAGWAHSVLFAADLKHFKDIDKTEVKKKSSNVVKRPAQARSKDTTSAKRTKKK
ncbi:N-glycosylase/DNA lyase-like isoform X1 [Haliotis rufescens]|uniref:N-glycosylase/DNA lyase-like isoform X1 n=1 Tax=Haliotis rufescens TaxID=6454 RepID=UPI00201F9E02|nr:N-glycosylase/DNA lyase-like isoform X1 [Haliotis rufescens]